MGILEHVQAVKRKNELVKDRKQWKEGKEGENETEKMEKKSFLLSIVYKKNVSYGSRSSRSN